MTKLLDPRNGPSWDLPPPDSLPENYVIASIPRSGSTLLARLLWDCGQAGAPSEYLNPMQLCDWERRFGAPCSKVLHGLLFGPFVGAVAGRSGWGLPRLHDHLARVRWRRSSHGRFGLKLHLHHLRQHNGAAPPERLVGPCRWLRIRRRDRLGQAISWSRALQTGQWAHWQRGHAPPIYLRGMITRMLQTIDEHERAWDVILRDRPHVVIWHEALRKDPTAALRDALAHLGHPDPSTVTAPVIRQRPQADGRSAAWRRRYEAGR